MDANPRFDENLFSLSSRLACALPRERLLVHLQRRLNISRRIHPKTSRFMFRNSSSHVLQFLQHDVRDSRNDTQISSRFIQEYLERDNRDMLTIFRTFRGTNDSHVIFDNLVNNSFLIPTSKT